MKRIIEPALVSYIDNRLKLNGLAQHALKTKDARLLMTEAAKVCVGIREKTGNNDGPMVELIQETIGKAENESWCAAFVQSMIAYAEVKTGVTSPIIESEGCTEIWEKTPREMRVVKTPAPGAIVIWQKPGSWKGHTGIVLTYSESYLYCVEGNTTSGISANEEIIADGGGIYYTKRTTKSTKTMNLVGFLKPF